MQKAFFRPTAIDNRAENKALRRLVTMQTQCKSDFSNDTARRPFSVRHLSFLYEYEGGNYKHGTVHGSIIQYSINTWTYLMCYCILCIVYCISHNL